MKRLLLGLLAVLASVSSVRADVPVPPPKGKKFVPVKHLIRLDKDISGYVFFTRSLGLRNGNFEKIELSADKAAPLTVAGKFGQQLLAVPDAVVKKYPTEKDLLAALSGKLDGAASSTYSRTALLPEKDERKELTVEHVITGFDARKGIQMKDNPDTSEAPKEEESVYGPRGIRPVISSLAAAAALALGGLWLVRRQGTGEGKP